MSSRQLEKVIPPEGTLGILGSGQLGRMLAMAAKALGYRVHLFSPEADAPASSVVDLEVVAPYEDLTAAQGFAAGIDVLTFEFENVPAATARVIGERAPVRPAGEVLHITQNRLREKEFLASRGIPVTEFRAIRNSGDLEKAVEELGMGGILKTADFGYDGKGQFRLKNREDLTVTKGGLGGGEWIYEAYVPFVKELSVVAARGLNGEFAAYPVLENRHVNHILDVTLAPALASATVQTEAVRLTAKILEDLDVVGLLTVEFFLTEQDEVLVNELAPRTHNSGHLTLDACYVSQFEQQVRAVCGLPLGSTELFRPAAMANILGNHWNAGEPHWAGALEDSRVKLHLYGKAQPRDGRKMGHLTAVGATAEEAARTVMEARQRLAQ